MFINTTLKLYLALLALTIVTVAAAQSPLTAYKANTEDEFLPPDEAFVFSVKRISPERYVAQWVITQDYYLYRDKIAITAEQVSVAYQTPDGILLTDPYFGETEVYRHTLSIPFFTKAETANLAYQGCADAGLCYPVQTKRVQLAETPLVTTSLDSTPLPQSEHQRLSSYLHDAGLWLAAISFFGMGLLLALTPCVLPMVPILSAIITMSSKPLSPKRAFGLSLSYVLAMAITFSIAGIIVALYGKNVHAWFQQPVVIIPFVAVFVLLALAMLDIYQLRLPSSLQTRLNQFGKQHSGSLSGAVIMGSLSSLVVSPCVTPALIGALLFVAQTGDVATGGIALLSLGLGMGAPLLAVGTSLGGMMPRPGPLLDIFKGLFGFIMFGFAIWMLDRIVTHQITLLLSGLLLIFFATYLIRITVNQGSMRIVLRIIATAMMVYGVWLFVNASLESNQQFTKQAQHAESKAFPSFSTLAQVNTALQQASVREQPTMLVFYADWCISCKELEALTFSDGQVQQLLTEFAIVEADVTDPNEHSETLLKHFALFGPPALLFFDKSGAELPWMRIVGFVDANRFAKHLVKVLNPEAPL